MEVWFGLGAAAMTAVVGVLSTRLAQRFPARQLMAPLFLLNSLVLLPFAPFSPWAFSPWIVLLVVASAVALVTSSIAIWDMYDTGGSAPTVTAMSVSPLPAALLTGLLLPGELSVAEVVAALVVVGGVLVALRDQFGTLGRRRTMAWIVVAALGSGVVTVAGRLLADAGSGVVETYALRTGLGAVTSFLLWRPRDVPWREVPWMLPRSIAISTSMAFMLLGVQGGGDPSVVQTAAATGPLFAIGWDLVAHRRRPSAGLVAGAVIAVAGVSVVLLVGG